MHRDVDAGTFQRERMAAVMFQDDYWTRVSKSVRHAMKRASRGDHDPFEAMLKSSLPTGGRRG